ncbi:MAG: hypothetical protein WD335_00030 [Candidatus Paceibacterota bacterium]
MQETIEPNTTTFAEEIKELHEQHERVIREFKKMKPYFDHQVESMKPGDQRVIYNLLNTAIKKGMDEFKEHLEMNIRKDVISEFSQILIQEMEDAILLNREDEVKGHIKETKKFLIRYAGLNCAFENHNQIS